MYSWRQQMFCPPWRIQPGRMPAIGWLSSGFDKHAARMLPVPYFFLGFGLVFGFGFFFGVGIPFIPSICACLLSYFVFLGVSFGTETCCLYGVTLITIISPPPPCSSTLLLVV